jgi:hypothetical protein
MPAERYFRILYVCACFGMGLYIGDAAATFLEGQYVLGEIFGGVAAGFFAVALVAWDMSKSDKSK